MKGPLKVYRNKRLIDKTRTKSTETTPRTPRSIRTNKTKHRNKVQKNVPAYLFLINCLKTDL